MTSAGKIAANRANARRSTGPRTPAGRARSARNARRHGLSVSVMADAELSAQVMDLARRLSAEGGPYEIAVSVAEATLDLQRIRDRRHDVMNRASMRPRMTEAELNALEQRVHLLASSDDPQDLDRAEAVINALEANLREESDGERIARVYMEAGQELRRLETYERRALSRRKSALRAFDAARTPIKRA